MRHSNLAVTVLGSIALASLALGCAESAPEVAQDAVAADPTHYSLEFENDAVRLIRITYGPGETSVMHHHPASCAIALSDATWSMELPDGTVAADTGSLGDVECFEAEDHLPTNTSGGEAELILVEFKEGAMARSDSMPAAPPAVTADAAHYAIEFENEIARVVRVRYGAGETSVMHRHPAHCVIYLGGLPEGSVTFGLPDGSVVPAPAGAAGDVNCIDAAAHLPTNAGTGEVHVVLLELKGRAAIQ